MKYVILTEGGGKIGIGHITRCIALYQALEEKGDSVKLILSAEANLVDFISGINCQRFNWVAEQDVISDLIIDYEFVIIDSYLAKVSLYNKISEIKCGNLLMIDDCNRLEYPRGIVLNSLIYGKKLNYSRNEGVTYFLGEDFVMLRKAFWEVPEKKINKEVKEVLITFGGVFNESLVEKIVDSLKCRFQFNVQILGGVKNKIDENKVLDLMINADICISAGGQTTYELARVGVPTIGICFTENQRMNLEAWEETGFLQYAGWYNDLNLIDRLINKFEKIQFYDLRRKISQIGRNIVDGAGARRISSLLHAKLEVGK